MMGSCQGCCRIARIIAFSGSTGQLERPRPASARVVGEDRSSHPTNNRIDEFR